MHGNRNLCPNEFRGSKDEVNQVQTSVFESGKSCKDCGTGGKEGKRILDVMRTTLIIGALNNSLPRLVKLEFFLG